MRWKQKHGGMFRALLYAILCLRAATRPIASKSTIAAFLFSILPVLFSLSVLIYWNISLPTTVTTNACTRCSSCAKWNDGHFISLCMALQSQMFPQEHQPKTARASLSWLRNLLSTQCSFDPSIPFGIFELAVLCSESTLFFDTPIMKFAIFLQWSPTFRASPCALYLPRHKVL